MHVSIPPQVSDLKAAARGRRGAGGRAVQLLARPMRELMIDAEERLLQRTLRQSAEEAAAAAIPKPVAGKLLVPRDIPFSICV